MGKCGCRVEYKRDLPRSYKGRSEIIYCSLHAAAPTMKNELERLRDLVGEMDYELVDAVIALTEKRSRHAPHRKDS